MSTVTQFTTVSLELQTCISCGCYFGIPSQLDEKLRENKNSFYCPNGHSQHYTGKTEAEKLRDELKKKEQELADRVKKQLNAENQYYEQLNKTHKLERKLKRVHNGTCPCCKRSFANLAAHMKTKHPEELKKSLK